MKTSIIILSAADRDAGNQAAHAIGVDPLGLLSTLIAQSVPFPGPADAVATHFGLSGPLTDAQHAAAVALLGQFPNARFWDVENGKCVSSWDGNNIGQPWTYGAALASIGLQRRVAKMP